MEVYFERILKLANCLNHKVDDNLLMTFFPTKFVQIIRFFIAHISM
jgi:hypothetical protein